MSVLVAWEPSDTQRERVKRHIRHLFWASGWGYEVRFGSYGGERPLSKGTALWDAYRQSSGQILVITDADVWIPRLPEAVEALLHGCGAWVKAHDRVVRFSRPTTERILTRQLDFEDALLEPGAFDEPPSLHSRIAGAGTVLWREDFERAPVDPRFRGWGQEDMAWESALVTLVGEPHRLTNSDCWHLWHQPQERVNRTMGSVESWRLWRSYERALGDVEAMRILVEAAEVRPVAEGADTT